LRAKKLEDYIGKNEKTKIVAKLQKVLERLCAKMEGIIPLQIYIWISLGTACHYIVANYASWADLLPPPPA
jgi:hypothetical protein